MVTKVSQVPLFGAFHPLETRTLVWRAQGDNGQRWSLLRRRKLDFQGRFLVCHYHSLQYQSMGKQTSIQLNINHISTLNVG